MANTVDFLKILHEKIVQEVETMPQGDAKDDLEHLSGNALRSDISNEMKYCDDDLLANNPLDAIFKTFFDTHNISDPTVKKILEELIKSSFDEIRQVTALESKVSEPKATLSSSPLQTPTDSVTIPPPPTAPGKAQVARGPLPPPPQLPLPPSPMALAKAQVAQGPLPPPPTALGKGPLPPPPTALAKATRGPLPPPPSPSPQVKDKVPYSPPLREFNPSPQEWEAAKKALENVNVPDGTKFDKYIDHKDKTRGQQSNFSFIKVGGEIYAMSNKTCFGPLTGAFGRFKLLKNEKGDIYGMKIEATTLKEKHANEAVGIKVGKEIGLIIGQAQRSDSDMRHKLKKYGRDSVQEVQNKVYTVMKWGGQDLVKLVNENKPTPTQMLLIALNTCTAVHALHEKGIVHADLKEQNITAGIDSNNPTKVDVTLIDVDNAKLLEGEKSTQGEFTGTVGYAAPEVFVPLGQLSTFSPASDIYSLGIIFDNMKEHIPEFKMPPLNDIINKMKSLNPADRPSLDTLAQAICKVLEKKPASAPLVKENGIKQREEKQQEHREALILSHMNKSGEHQGFFASMKEGGELDPKLPVTDDPQSTSPHKKR